MFFAFYCALFYEIRIWNHAWVPRPGGVPVDACKPVSGGIFGQRPALINACEQSSRLLPGSAQLGLSTARHEGCRSPSHGGFSPGFGEYTQQLLPLQLPARAHPFPRPDRARSPAMWLICPTSRGPSWWQHILHLAVAGQDPSLSRGRRHTRQPSGVRPCSVPPPQPAFRCAHRPLDTHGACPPPRYQQALRLSGFRV